MPADLVYAPAVPVTKVVASSPAVTTVASGVVAAPVTYAAPVSYSVAAPVVAAPVAAVAAPVAAVAAPVADAVATLVPTMPEGADAGEGAAAALLAQLGDATTNEVDGQRFTVNLIPHTLAVTTLGKLAAGAKVNLEVDLLARYVERLRAVDAEQNRPV